MLPNTRQRLIMTAALAIAIGAWMLVRSWLVSPDLSSGISLTSAAAGWFGAVIALVFAGGIATLAGLVPAGAGHPLSAVFVVGIGLCVLAGWGGPIDGWMFRASLPGAYLGLIIEMVIWSAGITAMVLLTWTGRAGMRRALPRFMLDEQHDQIGMPEGFNLTALLAGVIAIVVGSVASWVLLRSTDVGQVIGALIAAFLLAGLAAQSTFPSNRHVLPILLSPAAVAIVAYLLAWASYSGNDATLAAWFNLSGFESRTPRIAGPALVLPIYYASAGLAGASMGIGIAQTIQDARHQMAGTSA